jgi:hypothetical protein
MSLPVFHPGRTLFHRRPPAACLPAGPLPALRPQGLSGAGPGAGQLEGCYCADNGRVACEPVLLLGVSFLQYLEGVPDRQAVELLRYHAGWNFAFNRQVGDAVFHPTTLVGFRQRLLAHDLSTDWLCHRAGSLDGGRFGGAPKPPAAGFDAMFGRVSRMSRLDCVRESVRLALEELAEQMPDTQRPEGGRAGGSVMWRPKRITAPRWKHWRASWGRRGPTPGRCSAGWPARRTSRGRKAGRSNCWRGCFGTV